MLQIEEVDTEDKAEPAFKLELGGAGDTKFISGDMGGVEPRARD